MTAEETLARVAAVLDRYTAGEMQEATALQRISITVGQYEGGKS